mmetsp:Transcript_1584/g.2437  ORF Transcript_1584/g.2437 Transcript_1584/m.2437 type:complete len:225 (-) Transcript_1584:349-1023(-)
MHLLFCTFFSEVGQQLGRFQVVVGLPVQLNGLQKAFLLQQMAGVLGKQPLDLWEVMLLGQSDCLVPLVQEHATVDGFLGVTRLEERRNAFIAQAHTLKLVANGQQQGVAHWESVHEMAQGGEVLQCVETVNQHLTVLRLSVVLRCLDPFVTVTVVRADLVPGIDQLHIITTHLTHELLNLEPVSEPHAHVDSKVRTIHLVILLLRFVKALEVHRHLRPLFCAVV